MAAYSRLSAALAALAVVAACSKDFAPEEPLGEYVMSIGAPDTSSIGAPDTSSIGAPNASSIGAPDTKSILSEDARGKFGHWESGDRLGTAVGAGGAHSYSNIQPGTPSTFRIYKYGGISAGETVYAYYPYDSGTKSMTEAHLKIPPVQHQAGGSFDFDAMPMAAEGYVVPEGVPASGNFAYLGEMNLMNLASLIQFQVFSTDSRYASEVISSVTFNAAIPISGAFTKDITAISATDESTLAITGLSSTSVQTSLSKAPSLGTSRESAADVYMVVAPGRYGGSIVVVTDKASYTYQLSDRTFRRSGMLSFGLDLATCRQRHTDGSGGGSWLDCLEVPAVSLGTASGSGYNDLRDDIYWFWDTDNAMQRIATHTFADSYGRRRNYTVLFDGEKHCPLWTAHAMHAEAWADTGVDRSNSWDYDPAFPAEWQQTGLDNAKAVGYSKGHFVASNYRKTTDEQNAQTFYYTNQAPQWQNSFNSGVWSTLEASVKNAAPSGSDTLYVVTGVLFEGDEMRLPSKGISVAVPSHFYKCLMKCSFDSSGEITGASGTAFIYTNEAHSGVSYNDSAFITTIDEIESRTGYDFFPRVPSEMQNAAEAVSTALWEGLRSFGNPQDDKRNVILSVAKNLLLRR
ncbi:MAG: DNA/RNA non-specific endonuclease [Bacteroidales bacterium]|nr:DNA/RNA non-specific endonuclease [Bacteroidales bacterium]